jgi:transcriptional regulator with XRE-family HTH domain
MNPDTEEWLRDVEQPDYTERLKKAMGDKGVTHKEFAKLCGCSPSNVSAVLRGESFAGRVPKYMWRVAKTRLGL